MEYGIDNINVYKQKRILTNKKYQTLHDEAEKLQLLREAGSQCT
jgi:hypothetical protein